MSGGSGGSPLSGGESGGPPLLLKFLGIALAMCAVIAFLVGSWFYWKLKGSMPVIAGTAKVPGLSAPVKLERDAQGVPTITGANFADVARGLGYAHGQDRFFEMDLARRRAAGELAEIFGKGAVELDQQARVHDFRVLARAVLKNLPASQRADLEAYAQGVNAGLASLSVKPFEYVILRVKPAPWRPEDSVLQCYAMALTLQNDQGQYLRTVHRVQVVLGIPAVNFFSPLVGPMDAALDGSTAALPAVPGPGVLDLRAKEKTTAFSSPTSSGGLRANEKTTAFSNPTSSGGLVAEAARACGSEPGVGPKALAASATIHSDEVGLEGGDFLFPGSNALAVAGQPGHAVLANDMHLDLTVPNIWYRASLVWPGHRVTGVTLPGAPAVIAGSNGQIAWGLTNSGTGTGDLILVKSDLPDFYRGPQSLEMPIKPHVAMIHVKGGSDVRVSTDWTVWGPIVDKGDDGQLMVYHWTEDDAAATNLEFSRLMEAGTVAEAVDIAHRSGIPNENFLVADASGKIAWTIAGRLPKRVGYTGRWAVLWQYGDRKWDGFVDPQDVPVVMDRDFLWSANQRMLGGAALETLGDSGYARAARAGQIRDDLMALRKKPSTLSSPTSSRGSVAEAARAFGPTPGSFPKALAASATHHSDEVGLESVGPLDLLKIELDDRAQFLGWWRELALRELPPGPVRDAFANDSAAASVDSVGYRLLREFRQRVVKAVLDPIFASCAEDHPDFDWSRLNYEPAVRELLTRQPMHLLDPKYDSWDALIQAALPTSAAASRTWGAVNTLKIEHPFSQLLPHFLTFWLNYPSEPVPGDIDMPRVQGRDFGASERFAVSPGHEDQGVFEMPGGQSAHPLSPFYTAGHRNWVLGRPSPFLPGPPAYTLMLRSE